MRGTYHIAGGLAMLGLGRACVTVGERMGQSQAMIDSGEPSWMSNALDTVSGVVQLGSTWIHQMFIPSDDQWLTSVAIGLPLFIIGTVLPDIDLPDSLAGRFMPWGTLLRSPESRADATSPLNHRGWTHTLWVLLGVGAATAWVWPGFIWLLAGMITHDLLDAGSMAGWIWYYPLFPSTWKVIERGETRIVVSTRYRSIMGNLLRYQQSKPWLEPMYVALLVIGAGIATWYTW